MLIRITLNGHGGELDSKIIKLLNDDIVEVSEAIHEIIDNFMLSPGDIIVIAKAGE